MSARRLPCLGLAALLGACAVGPDYHPPDTAAPPAWSGAAASPAYAATDPAAVLPRWWRQFDDPQLDRLVDRAVHENLDIRTAGARIAQARAQRDVAAGAWFPTLSGSGKASRYRVPDSLRNLPEEATAQSPAGQAPGADQAASQIHLPSYLSIYQLGFDTSWELDLFGKTRRSVEAADAATQAAVAARRGAVVSVLAELGTDYAAMRGAQAQIQANQHTVEVERQLLELTRSRAASGMASEVDVAQAQGQLDTTLSQSPLLEAQQLQAVHAIAVLVDRTPEQLEPELASSQPLPLLPPQIPVGLPASVLRNRPDIQQAERTLAAATAQVGVAEAQRFPSLSLTGSTGLASDQLDRLLRHSNWTWNAGASLTAPIFQGGTLAANQRGAEAQQQEDLLQYRKAVLQALQETEDALQSYGAECRSYDQLRAAEAQAEIALQRSSDRYRAGLGDYIDVLDADRSLAQLQSQLAQSGQDRMQQLIALYKALGGGWQAGEQPQPAAAGG